MLNTLSLFGCSIFRKAIVKLINTQFLGPSCRDREFRATSMIDENPNQFEDDRGKTDDKFLKPKKKKKKKKRVFCRNT